MDNSFKVGDTIRAKKSCVGASRGKGGVQRGITYVLEYSSSPTHNLSANGCYCMEDWELVEKETNKLNNKNMIQKLTEAIKRGLKSELHAQYEVGFLDGGLERTEEGTKALLDILSEENQEKLNEVAKAIIAEEKKKENK